MEVTPPLKQGVIGHASVEVAPLWKWGSNGLTVMEVTPPLRQGVIGHVSIEVAPLWKWMPIYCILRT